MNVPGCAGNHPGGKSPTQCLDQPSEALRSGTCLSAAVVPAPWRRRESCGMLQAGDAALSHRPSRAASASPQKVWWAGVRGSQGAGEPLRQLCSFIRERVKMHLSRWFYTVVPGHTGSPQVWVLSPLCQHPPSKALHRKRLRDPSRSSPITPGLQASLHIPTAVSAQPGPSSLPAGTQQPLPLLPTPCPPAATTTEPQSPEKPRNLWKKQVPNPTLPPAPQRVPMPLPTVPAGTVPASGTCSPSHCSPEAPRSHPDA